MSAGLTEDTTNYSKEVTQTQTQADWMDSNADATIGGVAKPAVGTKGQKWTVSFDPDTEKVTISDPA